mmetsp:Transcript_29673/g.71840  ORF Transcript_29673/g.71840 Transcript_29673/m.71840 type:complete len:766 (+) Transcript_29673:258-2555(+)
MDQQHITPNPKKRSVAGESDVDNICRWLSVSLNGFMAGTNLPLTAKDKLENFVRKYLKEHGSLLFSSKEEFAKELEMEGEIEKKAAYWTYEQVTQQMQKLKEVESQQKIPETPRTTAHEIQRAIERPYSTEGSETAPDVLLDNELTKIVEETDRVPGGHLDGSEPAPFVCLLQSTGYGKTRAVLRLAETKRKVVYLPWKAKNNNNNEMPKVLISVKAMLSNANTDPRRMLLWDIVLGAVEQCADECKSPQDLFEAQKSGIFYTKLEDRLHKSVTPTSKRHFKAMDETPRQIKRVKFMPENRQGHYYYRDPVKPQSNSLVVCLDEVTGLSYEIYRSYRRVAKQRGLLSIFADTATSICRVVPANDHSSNDHMGELGRFAKPLFGIETIDIDLSVKDRLAVQDNDYENLFCAGRPLWRTYFEDHKKDIKGLLKYAENLLTQSKDEDNEELQSLSMLDYTKKQGPQFVDHNMIAVFACRFALGRESRMAPLLVKHSLATVIGVTEDRSTVLTSYPSEPILPEVSARYTNRNANRQEVLNQVLCAFNNRTKLLDPPTGDVGEMCAAALLGYLMDIIRVDKEHEYMSQPVPLLDLLKFFGAKIQKHGEVTKGWEVNFTHFIRPDEDPGSSHLNIMWKRRVAYYVPDGCDGLDLLVVIKHQSGGYGTLRIQVKNYSAKITKGDVGKILFKLLPNNCPPKVPEEKLSVGLLLCVGDVDERCDLVQYENGKAVNKRSSTRKKKKPSTAAAATAATATATFMARSKVSLSSRER